MGEGGEKGVSKQARLKVKAVLSIAGGNVENGAKEGRKAKTNYTFVVRGQHIKKGYPDKRSKSRKQKRGNSQGKGFPTGESAETNDRNWGGKSSAGRKEKKKTRKKRVGNVMRQKKRRI